MAKKTPLDKMADAIAGILDEYSENLQDNLVTVTEQVAKKGAQALNRQSKAEFGSGEYSRGWKVETEGKNHRQLVFSSTIYNEHPGLPHLLEHGHVTRNGTGRTFPPTPAHEHIKPVEEELIETYEREVVSKL